MLKLSGINHPITSSQSVLVFFAAIAGATEGVAADAVAAGAGVVLVLALSAFRESVL